MKIILLADIKGVGKRNDCIAVADGYALNFILPKKLGIRATPVEIARCETLVKREQANITRLQAVAIKLAHDPLAIKLKTGAHGEVFNSITKDDIRRALEIKGYTDAKEVAIAKPIRVAGEHPATVRFGHGIEATLTIVVAVDK